MKRHRARLEAIKARLWTFSLLRLAVFGLGALGVYLLLGNAMALMVLLVVVVGLFLFLVSRHTDLKTRRNLLRALVRLNETELEVLDFKFHDLPAGDAFKDPSHAYSQDIDLFGKGSFFQYCNRTALSQGGEKLAHLLKENHTENIMEKQEAVKELSHLVEWRQEFWALGTGLKTEVPHTHLIHWIQRYTPFVPSVMKTLSLVFGCISLVLWALFLFGGVSGWWVIGWFFIGLGISLRYVKAINRLSRHTSGILATFQQYQKLIVLLEGQEFRSTWLLGRQTRVLGQTEKVSRLLQRFSKLLNALDQRNNVLVGILANGFLLRDLWLAHGIEEWIKIHQGKVADWFRTITFFDAYNSLGNFAYNHPQYTFPELSQGAIAIRSQGLGHPLLPRDKGVPNDLAIDQEQFFIITGANMAGKSTFLRAVSLQIVMANMGLPVCASRVEYSPIKLITSMRTTDSLTDNESYFFSELKRLKFIVDQIKDGRYFIVLDEILKGTNSTDKARGSRKFVERLVASKSTGLLATHDVSLCDAARELPQAHNYYFDAQIIDGELFFDYTIKEGICTHMNASFLLRKMGIVE
ncbi:MAG: DNA mismatch repair protein MutS [Bacteroidota bacterium]